MSCSQSHHTLLACASKSEQNKIRIKNSQQNFLLNADASSFKPSQPSVHLTNEWVFSLCYFPTAVVEMIETNTLAIKQ